MRAAVHLQALKAIFAGHCDPVTSGAILSARIAVTPVILSSYHAELGNNPQYQTWFSAIASRLTIHMPQVAPRKVQVADTTTDEYGTASYFGGSNLVVEDNALPPREKTTYAGIGVSLISPRQRINGAIHGDNPIYAIATSAGGSVGFEIFDRFVLPEDNVVVYDKYINAQSVELLEHLASKLSAGSRFDIFHSTKTGGNLLSTVDIATRVQKANTAISVSCKACPHAFTSLEHDRYIFLGQRIQIVFTVGLDCLGPIDTATGRRVNRRSKILFYDITTGDPLDIQAIDGSVLTVKHHSSHIS